MSVGSRADRFRRARRDPALAVLEGFHPLKHALRFGAEIVEAATGDREGLARLADALAPDVADGILGATEPVSAEAFAALAPRPPATGVIAIARRPEVDLGAIAAAADPAPVVWLQRPRRLGNVGAAIRVAAAAGAAGVVTTGPHDPWHPAAIRGSAGLHWAVPVARAADPPREGRPLVAIDPGGRTLTPGRVPTRALLAFGGEREGLPRGVLDRAEIRLGIPMRAGVSSLNLATAVAVALYAWRFGGAGG